MSPEPVKINKTRDVCKTFMHSSLRPLWRKWKETANNRNYSKSKGHKFVKICSNTLQIELDLDILVINKSNFHISIYNLCEKMKSMETTNNWNIYLSKNCSIVNQIILDLDYILKINQISFQYHCSMCNLCKENDRKKCLWIRK